MTIRAAIAAFGLCGLIATPSAATEWINCVAPDGGATFDFLVGSLDFLSVAGLNISAGEKVWASSAAYGPGEPVVVGQAFETADTIMIDAMDESMATKVAELRLFKLEDAELGPIYGGTLKITSHGAWPVSCSGP